MAESVVRSPGGEVEMSWIKGVAAFIRRGRQRRELADAARLVREAEEWLASQPARPRRRRPEDLWPPLQGGSSAGDGSPS
jgi:hypothetical protein